jgi:glycosyltransferase involved in cell wall biosynthesis
MIKLSIIIPTYNRNEYIVNLLDKLKQQITDEVEVIVVDDNSNIALQDSWYNYIYLTENSGGASVPRNIGLDKAKGEYITFIDSDDLVSDDYIQTILEATKEN